MVLSYVATRLTSRVLLNLLLPGDTVGWGTAYGTASSGSAARHGRKSSRLDAAATAVGAGRLQFPGSVLPGIMLLYTVLSDMVYIGVVVCRQMCCGTGHAAAGQHGTPAPDVGR